MKFLPLLCLSLVGISTALAGGTDAFKSTTTVAVVETGPFEKGAYEFDITGGYLYSPVIAKGNRPVLTYSQGDLSLGLMLTSPSPLFGMNCLRGNWEGVGNVFGAGVFRGPSGFMAGGRLLMRYNFVQPDSKWVPFWQLGAGALGDNIYQHRHQTVVGGGFEFTLVTDAGIRYFITPKCAAILMIDYEHISNAGTSPRNMGVNAVGGTVGLGYFF